MVVYHTEGDVKREVKKLLIAHQWFWWMPPANGYGRGGAADFHALRNGVFMSVETKIGTNKATALQQQYLRGVRKYGGMAFLVSDRTLDAFALWLDMHARTTVPCTPTLNAEDTQVMQDLHALMHE